MSDMSRRATQVLDEARAGQPKLDSRRRERVRNAVVMTVATTAATAASGAQAAGWLTTTAGKLIIGVGAAIVGSGATVGVMLVRRAAVPTQAVVSPARVGGSVPSVVQRPLEPIADVHRERAVSAEVGARPEPLSLPTVTPIVVNAPTKAAPPQLARVAPPVVIPAPGVRDEVAQTPPVPLVHHEPAPGPVGPPIAVSASNKVPAPDAAKPLRDELTVLRLAMTHHDSGNDLAALSTLDEYDARFPNGVMVVEGQVLRVLALCQLARPAEARALLRQLELATPASPAVQRLKTSCAAQ